MAWTTEQRLVALAEALLKQSEAGKLEWRETDKLKSFIHTGASATIAIEIDKNGDYAMSIINEDGLTLDSINSADYNDYGNAEDTAWAPILRQLYDAARRKALDIDTAIDGLLKEFGVGPPPPSYDYGDEPF